MARATVRATVTNWVAPGETTKLQGLTIRVYLWVVRAILPAATAELHLNGDVPFHGDKVAGIR